MPPKRHGRFASPLDELAAQIAAMPKPPAHLDPAGALIPPRKRRLQPQAVPPGAFARLESLGRLRRDRPGRLSR